MSACRVVTVDVGSVRGNFAWAALDLPDRRLASEGGTNPEEVAHVVLDGLQGVGKVALGFESPLVVPVPPPVPDGWEHLGRSREEEGNRPWSAGAGSAALATGLVQMAWVLQRLITLDAVVRCTTQPQRWSDGTADLLIWEAFVSGPGRPVPDKGTRHAADAIAAADTFAERWQAGTLDASDATCPDGSFSLAAAAALHAGISIEVDEIHAPVTVLRSRPTR